MSFGINVNAFDMACGVSIGGALGKIVSSIVNDIIMPPIGWLIGGVNFTDLKIDLPAKHMGEIELEPTSINYGNFIQTAFDFLIIAFCVFLIVKGINKLTKKKEQQATPPAPPAPPAPSKEEVLLTEIRDLLKEKK
ncbi:MAG: large-conductance mechanosensitive channel protein MscL [Prevotella sp.]|nr:large-conductance mechanosensitive channel protein MscL [Prevotella sp.]